MDSTKTTVQNRLGNEKSPYLRQHSDNPVDWFPWGDEAFDKAKAEDKPILVSIGYATCHWCHVMAHESFEDPEVADIMNRYLVNVKIDREERPDLDQIYITAVSALTGSAGWPLNVFLTPDGKPFFGGTYFPTKERSGMPSWTEVVTAIGRAWQDGAQRTKLTASADHITDALKRHLHRTDRQDAAHPDAKLLSKAVNALAAGFDAREGGFSGAPKFPMPTILDFLLFYHRFTRFRSDEVDKGEKAAEMAVHTLKQMADGGIYDHIGGGFHRYATDAHWHVPHFEKMLYDNAQLIGVYLDAYEMTGETIFADVARDCLDYVFREMSHPDGGFYSAEDADSQPLDLAEDEQKNAQGHKEEGAYYVWRKAEIESLLPPEESEIAVFYWGIAENGNAKADPFGEFKGKNILFRARTIGQTAEAFGKTEEAVRHILHRARGALFEARKRRPRPFLDDKILTEWNALMISALAKAYRILGDELYLGKAREATEFIQAHLYEKGNRGNLYRRWRDGERKIEAMASDYALLIQALLDLYEAGFDPSYLQWAMELGDQMLQRFWDDENGGFFLTAEGQDRHLLFRAKDFNDGVTPSAGSVAALSCLRLYRLTGESRFEQAAQGAFRAASEQMAQHPASAPQLLKALGSHLLGSAEVIILGNNDDTGAKALLTRARSYPREATQVVFIDDDVKRQQLARILPHVAEMKKTGSKAAAFVCFSQACRDAVFETEALTQLMDDAMSSR